VKPRCLRQDVCDVCRFRIAKNIDHPFLKPLMPFAMDRPFTQPGLFAADAFPAHFINQSLLALAGLAVIPVILHFLLRHKPKKLLFPALRLLQLRKKNNVRRLRLKHIWLLLLRIAVVVLLVLALARPTLPAANYAPNPREWLTIFALVVLALGVYFGVMFHWRRKQIPNHAFTYRRSLLRAGTGIGLFVLLLLLFVWPYTRRVMAEIEAPLPEVARNLPVSAVFLFDDSLSMGYEYDEQTRLQAAAHIAEDHLETFPGGSQVALSSTSGSGRLVFQPDLVGVKKRVQALQKKKEQEKRLVDVLTRHKLETLLREAIDVQVSHREQTIDEKQSEVFLREIYVFTDLTASSWSPLLSESFAQRLKRHPWLRIYLIDVGIKKPKNAALSDVRLSQPSVIQSEELYVYYKVKGVGETRSTQKVQLILTDADGDDVVKGTTSVTVEPGLETPGRFALGKLTGRFRQGEIRIEGADPLEADDRRYFTVAVHPRPQVLIVSDSRSDAFLWEQALSPEELPETDRWFQCTYLPATKLSATDLSKYDAVYLINISRPTAEMFNTLERYVRAGGGLGIALGMRYSEETLQAWQSPDAMTVVPAKVQAQLKHVPEEYLDLRDRRHPVFATFEELGPGPLTRAPIRRYWRVEPLPAAKVIARYTDPRQSPAIITRPVDRGHTLMITTALGRRGNWNDLALSGWRYQELAHRMTRFLTGRATRSYNFQHGKGLVRVYWDRRLEMQPRTLHKPLTQISVEALAKRGNGADNAQENSLCLNCAGKNRPPNGEGQAGRARGLQSDYLDERGHYRLYGTNREGGTVLMAGFSYNASAEESDLTRITRKQLDGIFGPERYQIVRDLKSLERAVQTGRLGTEVYPLLVGVLLLIFCGEHFVANRFYESDQALEQE